MGEQLQILTVLPKSWSVKQIEDEFSVSNYMARKSKMLVKEHGVLSLPNPKRGPELSSETVHAVSAFYEDDDISRVMPGKKDFVCTINWEIFEPYIFRIFKFRTHNFRTRGSKIKIVWNLTRWEITD